jgi:hypothetical protein
MRTLVFGLVGAVAITGSALAQGTVFQPGYTRNDGTFVSPHYRTAPNSTVQDNWSTRGNVNPYTGQPGYRDPYATRPAQPSFGTPQRRGW